MLWLGFCWGECTTDGKADPRMLGCVGKFHSMFDVRFICLVGICAKYITVVIYSLLIRWVGWRTVSRHEIKSII